MESIKAKELKDDAILNVKVNKTFYLMSKSALYLAFTELHDSSVNPEDFINQLYLKNMKK